MVGGEWARVAFSMNDHRLSRKHLHRSLFVAKRSLKYVFVSNHKVASGTVNGSMWNAACEMDQWPHPYKGKPNKRSRKAPYGSGPGTVARALTRGCFTFAFVRNPYARLLSCYLHQIEPQVGSFAAFEALANKPPPYSFTYFCKVLADTPANLMDPHWATQADVLIQPYLRIDHLGYLETFEQDMQQVFIKIYGQKCPIVSDKKNKATGAGKSLLEFIDDRNIEWIQSRYQVDFETFGFSKDPSVREFDRKSCLTPNKDDFHKVLRRLRAISRRG